MECYGLGEERSDGESKYQTRIFCVPVVDSTLVGTTGRSSYINVMKQNEYHRQTTQGNSLTQPYPAQPGTTPISTYLRD